MVATKSKLQMEFNKEVTSAGVCVLWQFYKVVKQGRILKLKKI
jgi:hypothetical protein